MTGYPNVTKRLDSLGGEKGISFPVFGGVVVVVEEDVVAGAGAFAFVGGGAFGGENGFVVVAGDGA